MLASTTHQSDDLTNQPTLAAVAYVMLAKTDSICPGLEPSLDDDAVAPQLLYQAGGSIKPLTLAPNPEPEHSWGIVNAAQHGPGYSLSAVWVCDRVCHIAATRTRYETSRLWRHHPRLCQIMSTSLQSRPIWQGEAAYAPYSGVHSPAQSRHWMLVGNAPDKKNRWVIGFAAWTVESRWVEEVTLSMMEVGHTHEDIDAVFRRITQCWQRLGYVLSYSMFLNMLQDGIAHLYFAMISL
eukprot:6191371-Pleurochrysis_carterae.AAC.1